MKELQITNLIEYCYLISQRNKERLSILQLFLNFTRLKFPIKNKKPSVSEKRKQHTQQQAGDGPRNAANRDLSEPPEATP